MSSESEVRPFIVWFDDDSIQPLPVKAPSRPEAFRIGRTYNNAKVAAAVDEAGGESFYDIEDSEFITEDDV